AGADAEAAEVREPAARLLWREEERLRRLRLAVPCLPGGVVQPPDLVPRARELARHRIRVELDDDRVPWQHVEQGAAHGGGTSIRAGPRRAQVHGQHLDAVELPRGTLVQDVEPADGGHLVAPELD